MLTKKTFYLVRLMVLPFCGSLVNIGVLMCVYFLHSFGDYPAPVRRYESDKLTLVQNELDNVRGFSILCGVIRLCHFYKYGV